MTALTKLFRTTTFRLSLTYLALFGAAAVVAIFYIYWNTTVLLTRQLHDTIDAEIKGLAEQYTDGGLTQLVRTVADRSQTPGNSLYFVADADRAPRRRQSHQHLPGTSRQYRTGRIRI